MNSTEVNPVIRVPAPRVDPATEELPVVVVGVDGSPASVQALVWALQHARGLGAQVAVVTAWPLHAPVFVGEVPGHFSDARWQAVKAAKQAVAHADALSTAATTPLRIQIENAPAAEALVEASRSAVALVLGTDAGADETHSALVEQIRATAECPVVVVPRAVPVPVTVRA